MSSHVGFRLLHADDSRILDKGMSMDNSTPPLHVMALVFGMGRMTYGITWFYKVFLGLGHMASWWVSEGFLGLPMFSPVTRGLAQWMSQRLALQLA